MRARVPVHNNQSIVAPPLAQSMTHPYTHPYMTHPSTPRCCDACHSCRCPPSFSLYLSLSPPARLTRFLFVVHFSWGVVAQPPRRIADIKNKTKGEDKSAIQKFVEKCFTCCLWCLEECLKYINKNAYIETMLYGMSFCSACCTALKTLLSNIVKIAMLSFVRLARFWHRSRGLVSLWSRDASILRILDMCAAHISQLCGFG